MYEIKLYEAMPYFAEIPYYLWGQVNYDSEGNCKHPTDRNWTGLYLRNRNRSDSLEVTYHEGIWTIEGSEPDAARMTVFLRERCRGELMKGETEHAMRHWDHHAGMKRASQVAHEFQNSVIEPFDRGHWFWGSWKWIGWFGTEFTWVGRWIIHSVAHRDHRAVNLCIEWLKAGTVGEAQSDALRYALNVLTDLGFSTDHEWIQWYEHEGGSHEYPEPDFDEWYNELKDQYRHMEMSEPDS